MADKHHNLAHSRIQVAPSPAISGPTLQVTGGTGIWFAGVPYNATIWPDGQYPDPTNAEIVRVTGQIGDALTIVRHQEGTVARAIQVGDRIAAAVTAKILDELEAALPRTWNASTNTPTLVDGTGTPNEFYLVTVAGSQNLGSGAITFTVGDYIFYNGATNVWAKAGPGGGGGVSSVAGKTGAVTLVSSDVGLGSVNNTSDANKPVSTAQQAAIDSDRARLTALETSVAKLPTNTRVASYTFALSDIGKIIESNSASAIVFTIPLNSVVPFPLDTVLTFARIGTGSLTLTPAAGVTQPNKIDSAGTASRTVTNRFTACSIRQRAIDQWVLIGDIS